MIDSQVTLSHPHKNLSGSVQLTGSKSESNRALILQALSSGEVQIENLSAAADTVIMRRALEMAEAADDRIKTIDIGPAGTAMRFLTAFLNTKKGTYLLTGSERMKQRPIGILVTALQELGANISYLEKEGFPPLQIHGPFQQTTNHIKIQGDVSSQYLSALLLVASNMPSGLTLEIEGSLTSQPYLQMTLDMLAEAGIGHDWKQNRISILPQVAIPTTIYIEPDWSAASYWYSMVALSESGDIFLPGLKQHSLQGDIAIVDIMSHFGVSSSFEDNGVRIQKTGIFSQKSSFDLISCPDLAQTVIVCAAALKKDISLTGLETLKIKETDRIAALQKEMEKFGVFLLEDQGTYHLKTDGLFAPEKINFETYEDHRMAMAFAPLALLFDEVTIVEPKVVDKSYPEFWGHLKAQGFFLS